MNREIKFRALDLNGNLIYDIGKIEFFEGGRMIVNDEIPVLELIEFTGLKDKNGVEIYEGDVVVKNGYIWFDEGAPNYRGTVEMIYSQWQVVAHCINPKKQGISDGINGGLNEEGFDDGENSDWEVIGNIFENPELLEKEEIK